MMGSAMALLTGVAQASTGSTTPGEAAAPATDFLGALLAAAPVVPADPAAAALLPATPDAEAPVVDKTAAAELAALIATLLPSAVATDDAPADATTPEAAGGAQPAAATTDPAKTLEQLLQRLAQEAGGAGEPKQKHVPAREQGRASILAAMATAADVAETAPAGTTLATAAATDVARQPADAGLQQLLRAMAPRAATAEPQPAAPKLSTGKGSDAAHAFASPQPVADAAQRAPEVSPRPVVDAPPVQPAPLAAEPQPAAPAPSSPSAAQLQPQAAAMAQSSQPQVATQSSTPLAAQTVHTPVGTPRWADELGSRMMLMTVRGQHEGSLNLTPEHLGPLEVRVSVNQGTANVWFGAQHADTRAALTEALPRLRELFAESGLALGHAGVSQEAPRQDARSGAAERLAAAPPDKAIEESAATAPAARRVALGLVDTYA